MTPCFDQRPSSSNSRPNWTRANASRVQVEHFSKRFPGMTIEDGYAVSRAWVAR